MPSSAGLSALSSARASVEAFQAALREHGVKIRRGWLQEGDHHLEGGHHAMKRSLHSGTLPTAVLGSNDLTAIGAMGAIHEEGLEIPRDVSVVGFDDIELSGYTLPALTTLHVSRRELAATAFRGLFRGRETAPAKSDAKREHVIKTKLVFEGRQDRRERIARPSRRSVLRNEAADRARRDARCNRLRVDAAVGHSGGP